MGNERKLSDEGIGIGTGAEEELTTGSNSHSPVISAQQEEIEAELDLSSVIQNAMNANFGSVEEEEQQKEEETTDLDLNDAINDAFKNNMEALLENDPEEEEGQQQEEEEEQEEEQEEEEDIKEEHNLDLGSVINDAINQNLDAIKSDENIDPSLNLVDQQNIPTSTTETITKPITANDNNNNNNQNEDDLAHAKLDLNAAIANALTTVDVNQDQRTEDDEEDTQPKVTSTQKAHEDDVKQFDNLFNDIQNIMGDINQKETSLEDAMHQVDLNEVIQKSLAEQGSGSYDETNELQRAIADALRDHSKQQQTKPKEKKSRKKSKKSTIDLSNAIHDALKDSNIVDSNENDFQKALEDIVHDVVENTLNQNQNQNQGQLQIQHEQLAKLPKNDDLNWDSIMGNALQLAMNDEMSIDDDKKFKKLRNKKSNKNLIFIPDGTNRKVRNQIQIKKFNNQTSVIPKPVISIEMLINLLSSIDLKNLKSTSLIQNIPTTSIELIKKSVSTSISSLMSAPSIIPVTTQLPLDEKLKIDNRERKKRWREFNSERNRDLDLKTRVTKKAMSLFPGDEHELLRDEWIRTEFEKRRQKRLLKEQMNRDKLSFNGDNVNLVPYELIFHDIEIINKFVNIYNEMGGNISTDKILSSTMDKSVIISSISSVLAIIFMMKLTDVDDKNISALILTIVTTLNTFLDHNPSLMNTSHSLLPFNEDDVMNDDVNPESVSVNEKEAAIDELKKTMELQDELEFANGKSIKETSDKNNAFSQENLISPSLPDVKPTLADHSNNATDHTNNNTNNVNNQIENTLISDSMKRLSLSVSNHPIKESKMRNQMQVFKPLMMPMKKAQKKKVPEPVIDLTKFMKPTVTIASALTTASSPSSSFPITALTNNDQVIPEKRKGDIKIEKPPLKKALSPNPTTSEEEQQRPIELSVAPTPKLPQYLKSKVKAPITSTIVRPLGITNIKSPEPDTPQNALKRPGAFKKPITFGRVPAFRANVAPRSIVKKE